ncbi:class I SAM-dependent methyltransferase [Pendulispora brunnea]|uniref:S-adenosyl-L-methionine-dependent methyltransferase n=1 Tax=Pendulispora brunnea TaxID=2905690 RepID=A0ABZ2KA27_9BACT
MIEGKPSTTSTIVAFFRALNTLGVTRVRAFSDPFAVQLLPPSVGKIVHGAQWLLERREGLGQRWWVSSRGFIDTVALRSSAIDAAWAEAYELGVRQLVILGAGLDARAYRLDSLRGVRVFEIDHPATQQFKRARAASLQSPAESLRYVPVDFARDDLGGALRNAGLRTDERAFVIWEGVTMYLPHRATAETLANLSAIVPSGSRLAMTYLEPATRSDEPFVRRNLRRWILSRSGEPQLGLMHREHATQLLEAAHFRPLSDENRVEFAARFSDESPEETVNALGERLVVAERT